MTAERLPAPDPAGPDNCDALFVVKTPLQVLNATEARCHFGFHRAALVLLTSAQWPASTMLPLVDRSDWALVETYALDLAKSPPGPPLLATALGGRIAEWRWVLEQWRRRRGFDSYFRPWRRVPNLVLGNYHQGHYQHLATLCGDSRCILLDDGTDTFHVAAWRRKWSLPVAPTAPPPATWHRPTRWWASRYAEWGGRQRESVVFFSTYDLDLPPCDELVPNRYAHLRARARKQPVDGRHLFLGQPLVEDGYLSLGDLQELLKGVQRSFGDRPLVYVPHPREDRATLAARLAGVGVSVQEIDKPVEYHLLEGAALPETVSSFFSSALDNCRLIWGDHLRLLAFRIPPEQLRVGREFVAEVYSYLGGREAGAIQLRDPGDPI